MTSMNRSRSTGILSGTLGLSSGTNCVTTTQYQQNIPQAFAQSLTNSNTISNPGPVPTTSSSTTHSHIQPPPRMQLSSFWATPPQLGVTPSPITMQTGGGPLINMYQTQSQLTGLQTQSQQGLPKGSPVQNQIQNQVVSQYNGTQNINNNNMANSQNLGQSQSHLSVAGSSGGAGSGAGSYIRSQNQNQIHTVTQQNRTQQHMYVSNSNGTVQNTTVNGTAHNQVVQLQQNQLQNGNSNSVPETSGVTTGHISHGTHGSNNNSQQRSPVSNVQQQTQNLNHNLDILNCFIADVSCLGEGGFSETNVPGLYGKATSSHDTPSLLVSNKGFSSGKHYWELVNEIQSSSSQCELKIGVLPRGLDAVINLHRNLDQNRGYGCTLIHNKHIKAGDTIGILLDLSEKTSGGKLSFFINGEFRGEALSVVDIPKNRALFPAFSVCSMTSQTSPTSESNGQQQSQSQCFIQVREEPTRIPDIEEHARQERCFLDSCRTEILARKIAFAHTGATLEINASVSEDLKIRRGDAILFVEKDDMANNDEWQFQIENESILAQDLFYMHREFDSTSGPNESRLKVAFKFVGLTPGTTVLSSMYNEIRSEDNSAESGSGPGSEEQKWDHWVRVIVLGD